MKIDRSKLTKKLNMSYGCKMATEQILTCDRTSLEKLGSLLLSLSSWKLGKINFSDWADVFDLFDDILAEQTERVKENEWTLKVDKGSRKEIAAVYDIIQFSAMLLEHCRGMAAYNSIERMTALLESDNLSIVSAALNVLHVCCRRGSFQTRLAKPEQQEEIINRLTCMAKTWPGYEYGLTLPLYCSKNAEIPALATTVSFEVELDENGKWPNQKSKSACINRRTLVFDSVHKEASVSQLTNKVMEMYGDIPRDVLFELQHKMRLAHSLGDSSLRLESVIVRLRAFATLIHWVVIKDFSEFMQFTFYEECFDLLKLPDENVLFLVKSEVFKALATLIQYERSGGMQKVVAASGASYYHGFLPNLTRACVKQLMERGRKKETNYPPDFIMSLLSFLYYFTGYQQAAQLLSQNGILEALFMLVSSNLTSGSTIYITRAVRVIDSASQFDSQIFQNMDGMYIFIHRLSVEIERCRKDLRQEQCVFDVELDISEVGPESADDSTPMEVTTEMQFISTANVAVQTDDVAGRPDELSFSRKSLIRCLISFIKKTIPDLQFSETVRHLMDGNFYNCVKHIVENRDYYGISLFILAINTVSAFIMQEPSQLSVLQSRGLTAMIFQKLVGDELPANREVFASLPTIYSSLCLNETGVAEFLEHDTFAKTFDVLVQPKYVQILRRRVSDSNLATVCETAASLGGGIDMLVRQQSRLRAPAISQFLAMLVKLDSLCRDPAYKCSTKEATKTSRPKQRDIPSRRIRLPGNRTNAPSDDVFGSDDTDASEDEEPRPAEMPRENAADRNSTTILPKQSDESKRNVLPLFDYVHNVIRFTDTMMNGQTVDEYAKMFADRNGLTLFFRIFTGPNLPPLCYNLKLISQVASVFRVVFTYTRTCTIVKEFINEMKRSCFVAIAELLHSSWERQGDSSALMDAFLSDTDSVETGDGVTFFRPLENLLFFVSVLNEFLRTYNGGHTSDWRNGVLREILGSGLVHMLGLTWRAVSWEDTRIKAVHFPQSKPEDKSPISASQSSAIEGALETSPSKGVTNGQPTTGQPNEVIKQLLILTDGLPKQIRRTFAHFVNCASGAAIRNRRINGYVRCHPPIYGDPLMLSVIFAVHQSLIRSFSARQTALPKMWATFMLQNIQALQVTLFEDSKRMLHSVLEKLHSSGLFATFLRCLLQLVDDDSVWEPKFISSAGDDFKHFMEESLWLIENILGIVGSPQNEDALDRQTVTFLHTFMNAANCLLYPLVMGLWKRVVRSNNTLPFLLDPLLALICQATQREYNRMVQKPSNSEAQAASDEVEVRNEMERFVDHSSFERLLDMGFSRELALDALLTCSNVEQATEFCLVASANSRRRNQEALTSAGSQPSQESAATPTPPPPPPPVASSATDVDNQTTSPRDAFLTFARQFSHLYGLLDLLESYPALVYRTADLVIVTVKLCGFANLQPFFSLLLGKIALKEKSITSNLVDDRSDVSKDGYQHLCIGDLAQSLSVHLHLLSLLLHEFGAPIAYFFFRDPELILSKLFGLTEYAVCYYLKYVTLVDCTAVLPRWLTPLLVCLDLYEAAVAEVERIRRIPKCHSLLWQYFDRKWIPYHLWTMRLINNAYQDGESSLRLSINRRRVMIDFNKMVQINMETGVDRKVMFYPILVKEGEDVDTTKKPFSFPSLRYVSDENFSLPTLEAAYQSRLLKICCDLLCPQTESDCLQAVLRLCLRFTRNHSLALAFVSSGGVEKLLELRASQFFNELTIIVSLIVRHLLEDAPVLDHLMEKTIRTFLGRPSSNNNASPIRDFNFMLRSFEHVACRDMETFIKVVCRVVRLKASLPSSYERDNPDARATCPFLNIRCEPSDDADKCPPLGHTSQTVLSALLNYLTRDLETAGTNASEAPCAGKSADVAQNGSVAGSECPVGEAVNEGGALPTSTTVFSEVQTSNMPSVSRSSVLALLAELIHNYPEVPDFFVSYRFPADLVQRSSEAKKRSSNQSGGGPIGSPSRSALAYILDNLLIEELMPYEKECGSAVKLVIASLAASTQNEEVLSMLVTEVKLALLRALMLPQNCLYKHRRIMAIVSLVTVMKNACPWRDGNSQNRDQRGAGEHVGRANSIVKWIQKKRLLTDLANVPHYLNLSDPNTIGTMNAVLKAMEDIARFVLCPVSSSRSAAQNRTIANGSGSQQQSQQRQPRQAANSHRHRHGSSSGRQGSASRNSLDISFLENLFPIVVRPVSENRADQNNWDGNEAHPGSPDGNRPSETGNGDDSSRISLSFGRAEDMAISSQDNEDGSAMDISSQEGDILDEEVIMVEEDGQRSTSVTEGEEDDEEEEDDDVENDEDEEEEDDDDDDDEYEEEEEGENEEGNDATDQEEEESEYEDINRNLEEDLRISMQELASVTEDFDIHLEEVGAFSRITEALRRALVPASNHSRSSRELVSVYPTGTGMGFTIPDVEQFLAATTRPYSQTGTLPNMPIAIAHPILLRHSEPSAETSPLAPTNGPGATHRQLMVVRPASNLNRTLLNGSNQHTVYRLEPTVMTRRQNARYRAQRDVFSLVGTSSLNPHARLVPYLDFSETTIPSDLPNSLGWEELDHDTMDLSTIINSSSVSWEFESRLLDSNYCNVVTTAVRFPILDVLNRYYDEEMKDLEEKKAREDLAQVVKDILNVTAPNEPPTADAPSVATASLGSSSETNIEQPETGSMETATDLLTSTPMDQTTQPTIEEPRSEQPAVSADPITPSQPLPTAQVQEDTTFVAETPTFHTAVELPASEDESGADGGSERHETTVSQAEVVTVSQPDAITIDLVGGGGGEPVAVPQASTGLSRVTDPRLRAILGDVELPEGIDQNFLAELPENIREEVIADQLQILRAQQQMRQSGQRREGGAAADGNASNENALDSDISYEFLVALPPELQDEVLAQHRLSRQQARQQREAPDAPLDLAAFFDTLPRALREQVLADADDSQIALLPNHIAEEARRLRATAGNRDPYHVSMLNSLRQYGMLNRFDIGRRSATLRTTLRRQGAVRSSGYRRTGTSIFLDSPPNDEDYTPSSPPPRLAFGIRCSPLLDKESLSCLIVLFFCHNPNLNSTRLHRLFKNLCYEPGTRDWLIRTFLSILDRTYRSAKEASVPKVDWASLEASSGHSTPVGRQPCPAKASSKGISINTVDVNSQRWLNLVVKSSMGTHIEVFQPRQQRSAGKRSNNVVNMNINPLFLPALCCEMIASLTTLAKIFPTAFFPGAATTTPASEGGATEEGKKPTIAHKASSSVAGPTASAGPSRRRNDSSDGRQATNTDFWEILMKLDATSVVGKNVAPSDSLDGSGKPLHSRHVASFGYPEAVEYTSLEEAPFGQLMLMLSHPVIMDRPYIMNYFLRLLSTIADALDTVKLSNLASRGGQDLSERVFLEEQLKLLIEMHTRCKNGDDSRGDSDNLLTKCALNLGLATQRRIFHLLVNAAVELAGNLSDEINALLHDLQQEEEDDRAPSTSSTAVPPAFTRSGSKGIMVDRFTGSTVIVSGNVPPRSARPLAAKELQCASILKMNEKNSTQVCLLRTVTLFLKLKSSVLRNGQPPAPINEQTFTLRNGSSIPVSVRFREILSLPPMGSREPIREEQQQNAADAPSNEQATTEAPSTSREPNKAEDNQLVTKEELEALCTTLKDNKLWELLSTCLSRLALSNDPHTVLVLQPAVEAFFILHADNKSEMEQLSTLLQSSRTESESTGMEIAQSPTPFDASTSVTELSVFANPGYQKLSADIQKFVRFAEKHRSVLNQILRQTKVPLNSGPFSVLVNYTRILDFDIKRKYFRRELEAMEQGYRGEDIAVRVKRDRIFQNSFRELCRLRSEQWKGRFYIMFEGEEGQDAGGLLREWFSVITREIFNPNYALFMTSPGDRVTYMINPASYVNKNHLEYFQFIGRLIAKAVFDNKYLDCYFTRAFYKHILGKPVKYTDMESEDPSFYQSLFYLLENPVSQLGYDITFSLEVEEFGVRDLRDLKENGRSTLVTDQNKQEYVNLVCQMKMTGAIRQQLNAFLKGFYEIIPKELISIFNEQELELLISGLPIIDIDDLQQNTEYHKYTKSSVQIQWFWRAVRSFDHADRAKLLQFVTGTSRVPLQGFASLQGMHGVQRFQIHRDDRSVDRLPTAHTCFNQLDLPPYESYDKLRQMLLLAIRECSEGFGFA